MKLYFYHLPELCPVDTAPECAIVIDVLRATTTIAAALAAGAEAIQAFSDIDELMQASTQWPAQRRLRAGERGGQKVAGFDLGNSPLDCTPAQVQGRRLFFSTTNGTRALQRVRSAPEVLTAALVNRQRTVRHLLEHQPNTVWMVAGGWEGNFSLEDTVCAGAIADGLLTGAGSKLAELAGNDEMMAAIALYQQWQNRLTELLCLASHGQRLLRLGYNADLEYCAQTDVLDVLPIQTQPSVLVGHVENEGKSRSL